MAFQFLDHLESAEPRHHQVQDDQIRIVFNGRLDAIASIGSQQEAITLAPETFPDVFAHTGLIVDHEHRHARRMRALATVTGNQVHQVIFGHLLVHGVDGPERKTGRLGIAAKQHERNVPGGLA